MEDDGADEGPDLPAAAGGEVADLDEASAVRAEAGALGDHGLDGSVQIAFGEEPVVRELQRGGADDCALFDIRGEPARERDRLYVVASSEGLADKRLRRLPQGVVRVEKREHGRSLQAIENVGAVLGLELHLDQPARGVEPEIPLELPRHPVVLGDDPCIA